MLSRTMSLRVLVTGAAGLLGRDLVAALGSRGVEVERFDVRALGAEHGDVRDAARVRHSVRRCDGVIHLAAISRVVQAERDPPLCQSTNVEGLRNVLAAMVDAPRRPWLLFTSSREVYGQPESLPVDEDCPLRPLNVYGRSKADGEALVEAARRSGERTCIVRLSNVFGSVDDHADRVIPAFARGAVAGEPLRVDGADHTFDFTHTEDVTRGLLLLVERLGSGQAAPAVLQLVSGQPTTLGELAAMVVEIAGSSSPVLHATPRHFDVTRFVGDPSRAAALLGWRPRVSLREGLARLIHDFRRSLIANPDQETRS